jgi:hypothetical protein
MNKEEVRTGIKCKSIFLNNFFLFSSVNSTTCPSIPSNAFIAASASWLCFANFSLILAFKPERGAGDAGAESTGVMGAFSSMSVGIVGLHDTRRTRRRPYKYRHTAIGTPPPKIPDTPRHAVDVHDKPPVRPPTGCAARGVSGVVIAPPAARSGRRVCTSDSCWLLSVHKRWLVSVEADAR